MRQGDSTCPLRVVKALAIYCDKETILGVYDRTEYESNSSEMNKGHHTSYQYRIGNMKGGSNTVRPRPWLDYTTPLQCLSYKGSKGEGQRNKIYLGRFPYLQGHPVPQAGYTGDGGGESASHMPKSSFTPANGESVTCMPKSCRGSGNWESVTCMPKSCQDSGDWESISHMPKSC